MEEYLKPIISGTVVGIVMLFVQFFITPRMERNKVVSQEQWKSKRSVFSEAIALIDQNFLASQWDSPDNTLDQKPVGEKPPPDAINKVYSELMLLSDNIGIPKAFVVFFHSGGSAGTRGDFIHMLRKELFDKKTNINPEEIPFFFDKPD